jgi:hypothetical protein
MLFALVCCQPLISNSVLGKDVDTSEDVATKLEQHTIDPSLSREKNEIYYTGWQEELVSLRYTILALTMISKVFNNRRKKVRHRNKSKTNPRQRLCRRHLQDGGDSFGLHQGGFSGARRRQPGLSTARRWLAGESDRPRAEPELA